MTQQFTRVSAVATSLKEAVRLSTESYSSLSLSAGMPLELPSNRPFPSCFLPLCKNEA